MKTNWEAVREKVKATDKETLKKVAMGCDGHTIFAPQHFLERGLDASIVTAFTKTLRSGNHPKEQITSKDGQQVAAMTGVYGLEVIEFIACCFGVDSWKMGRGSRADHLCEQLLEKWK